MAFSDRELLARLIECEAGGEGEAGMKAVAGVVMNRVEAAGGLLRLTPAACWVADFAAWAAEQTTPGELTRQLEKTRARPVCAEEMACWLGGMKRLELGGGGEYERAVRQTAAVALRRQCGGLLYACGLCLDLMK